MRARKRFGQNFLTDQSVIDRIVSRFQGEHTIVEIGPGQGALTQGLLKTGAGVIAIELDRDLIPLLNKKFAHSDNLTLHQADALHFEFAALEPQAPLRLVGNLPYNVATPLIFKLLEYLPLIVDMHFMLQWEVATRLTATAGEKHYGQLSVVMQNLCTTQTLLQVPPEAFNPVPKVNSAVIQITPREKPVIPAEHHAGFIAIVKASFAQRRKTLRNNLKGIVSENEIIDAGIDPGLRAEVLEITQFGTLAEKISRQ